MNTKRPVELILALDSSLQSIAFDHELSSTSEALVAMDLLMDLHGFKGGDAMQAMQRQKDREAIEKGQCDAKS